MYQSIKKRVHNCTSENECTYSVPKFAQSQWCNKNGQCKRRIDKRGYVTQILPDNRLYENKVGCKDRTKYSIIKSGLQPNKNEPKYSYGYNDYLKNKRRMTYEMKLPTSKGVGDLYGHGGKCDSNIISGDYNITTNTKTPRK